MISPVHHIIFLLLFWLISVPGLPGQSNPSVRAKFTDDAIVIDGSLDETAWQNALVIKDFTQLEPVEGRPSEKPTEVRVIFGESNLYIGAILYDEPESVENTLGRRDIYNNADWFLVSIDSYFDRRTAFTFGVNAAGVQLDGHLKDNLRSSGNIITGIDLSWNAIWHSAVRLDDHGWIAEISIPYSMLRFSSDDDQTWGIHFTRRSVRTGEISEWPLISTVERSNFVAHFGHLTDIRKINHRNRIQIQPYILTGVNTSESLSRPGQTSYNSAFDLGGDVKLGLGSNIMLDATINPDFGQVEADPAVLNLTAFETRLTENRPFFMEGADIFRFGIGRSQLFHSRRIGFNNPILGAAKVSGRTDRGLSFGFLGASEGSNLEHTTNYGIGRLSQQIGSYSSTGAILTSYQSPAQHGGWRSFTGGVNWDLRNRDNTYGFEGIAALARRTPQLEDLKDEKGFMAGLVFRKRQGLIHGHLTLLVFSDQYNPNDIGWTTFERDFRNSWANLTYNINNGQSFGPFQRANITYYHNQRFSYADWLNIGDINQLASEWVTRNFRTITTRVRFSDMFGGYDQFETRGLDVWARPYRIDLAGEYTSDERKNWSIGHEGSYSVIKDGARNYGYKVTGRLDLSGRFSFSGYLDLNAGDGEMAWAANESLLRSSEGWLIGGTSPPADPNDIEDFVRFDDRGRLTSITDEMDPLFNDVYYVSVFGQRDTRSVDFTLRGSFGITNRISLQLYNQLFFARGRYQNFQIQQNRDKLVSFDEYPKRNEFSLSSMHMNMVLRWEYQAGSTLYLIWTQGRRERTELNPLAPWGASPYGNDFHQQVNNIRNIFPANSFFVKLNYAFTQ